MSGSARNPWIIPGVLAGSASALGIALLWPEPEISGAAAVSLPKSAPKKNDLCLACEHKKCAEAADVCFPPEPGTTVTSAAQPAPDPALGSACREVLECVRTTGCGKGEPAACYCGEGMELDACESAPAASLKGACKDVIQRHAGSEDPKVVAARFGDHKFGTGLAMSLHTFCDRDICKEVCR